MAIKGIFVFRLLIGYIFLSSGLICNMIQLVMLPIWYGGKRQLYRKCVNFLNVMHWTLIPATAQWWAGVKLNMYYTPSTRDILGKEHAICLMNHRGELDWVISWMVCDVNDILGNAKCYVKSVIRYVPVIGWSFWASEFIFLKRSLEKDRKALARGLENLCEFTRNFWMLIFCEGTRMTKSKHAASVEFSKKQGRQVLRHCLLPRTKGFVHTTRALKKTVKAVYDVTVAFGTEVGDEPTLGDMVGGKSSVSDCLVRRIPIEDIPDDEEECAEFLHKIWREKDDLMEFQKQHGRFPFGEDGHRPDVLAEFSNYIHRPYPLMWRSLAILVFWTLTTLSALFYTVQLTVTSASVTTISMLSTAAAAVSIVFYILLAAGKPQKEKA